MDADAIITAVQTELQRHTFDTFMDEPPSIVRAGQGVVVSGCPACKKQLQSVAQFMQHLLEEVLPTTIRKVVSQQNSTASWSGPSVDLSVRTEKRKCLDTIKQAENSG
jgi:hypothetical protein